MVDDTKQLDDETLDAVFHALADPTRRSLLMHLAAKPGRSVSQLAANHTISLNAISKHLKTLEKAALVKRRRDGRSYLFTADLWSFVNAIETVVVRQAAWQGKSQELDDYLANHKRSTGSESATPPIG